jgi:hypothetical protein
VDASDANLESLILDGSIAQAIQALVDVGKAVGSQIQFRHRQFATLIERDETRNSAFGRATVRMAAHDAFSVT